ncbi:MAG: hypothetical protein ACYST6_00550 [Planctomycetota bacterium]
MKTQMISKGLARSICVPASVLLMLSVAASPAFALDFMGPPTSSYGQGRVSAGVDYSYSDMDLELENGSWVEHLDGAFFDSGDAVSLTLKDFQMNKVYANLGLGLVDNLDVFLRLGVADATFDDAIWGDNEEFESHAEPAVGAGIRATFYENENFALGVLCQASWARFDGQLDSPYWPSADYVEVDIAEIQIAVGPTVKLTDQIAIYGGPFFHFVDGSLDDEFCEAAEGGLINAEYSWDVQESSNFGGYIGASLNLAENTSFNIEYQHTADADAIALSFAWKF